MKTCYPAVMSSAKSGDILVFIPDFNINTEGADLFEAMEMARDAIGTIGVDMEDDGEELPIPSRYDSVLCKQDELVLWIDIDFAEYRRENDMKAVRKNCTIPSWLNVRAEKAGINFSAVLQNALKRELKIKE